jgi:hypothetical protein
MNPQCQEMGQGPSIITILIDVPSPMVVLGAASGGRGAGGAVAFGPMPMMRFGLIPVLLSALCACQRNEAAINVPLGEGFHPLSISVLIGDEQLTLDFISPERARIIISTQAQDLLVDDEPVIRTVAVTADSYRQARAGVADLMNANGIRADEYRGSGIRCLSMSIGGNSGQLTMTIVSKPGDAMPAACSSLQAIVESYRRAPDIDAGRGR